MKLKKFSLCLFDGEGAGAEGSAADAGQQDGRASTDVSQSQAAADTQVNLEAEFDELTKNKFKDVYTKRTQKMINQRFRETKGLQKTVNEQAPIIAILKERYGSDDSATLLKALEEDRALYADEAEKANMNVEQYMKMRQLERKANALQDTVNRENANRAAQEIYADWEQQGERLKAVYPNFDLRTELNNPQFSELIKNGVPVDAAYKVSHIDEFLNGAIARTAQQTRAATAENIRVRGNRPVENGMGAQSAVSASPDYSKMTTDEIKDILARVMRGENV